MQQENWRPVVGYEGYYSVSDFGRVRSEDRLVCGGRGHWRIAKQTMLKQFQKENGYFVVNLKRDGVGSSRYVHRLVLEAFAGPCPQGLEASHADDVRENNHISNLSWQTHRHNIMMRGINGGDTIGEKSGTSVLTESCVHIIIAMLSGGHYTQTDIAKKFGVNRESVQKISKGVRWKHLPRPY